MLTRLFLGRVLLLLLLGGAGRGGGRRLARALAPGPALALERAQVKRTTRHRVLLQTTWEQARRHSPHASKQARMQLPAGTFGAALPLTSSPPLAPLGAAWLAGGAAAPPSSSSSSPALAVAPGLAPAAAAPPCTHAPAACLLWRAQLRRTRCRASLRHSTKPPPTLPTRHAVKRDVPPHPPHPPGHTHLALRRRATGRRLAGRLPGRDGRRRRRRAGRLALVGARLALAVQPLERVCELGVAQHLRPCSAARPDTKPTTPL